MRPDSRLDRERAPRSPCPPVEPSRGSPPARPAAATAASASALGRRGSRRARRVDDVDLRGAVASPASRVAFSTPAPRKTADGLAEAARDREQLEGGLADRTVDVVDQNQDLSHVCHASQMNLLVARNSASFTPPSPSSVTTVPACARRALGDRLDRGPRRAEPDLRGVDAEVGQRPGLHRLLLRRHDPLERRVAGLAGLVGHRTSAGSGAVTVGRGVSPSRRIVTVAALDGQRRRPA